MTNRQLELELAQPNHCPRSQQRRQRANQANWWFHQMHQLVDKAVDWEPAPRFQLEEQTWLNETRRESRD